MFEKEVRKRIDPGFVELVTGNLFRTRVYPIQPQGTRTVRVIYQDQAMPNNNDFLYQIPIQFQTRLESLDIILTCYSQQGLQPKFVANSNQILSYSPEFINNGKNQYTAEWHLTNVEPSTNSNQIISYILPDSLKPLMVAIEKDSDTGAYFAISCALPVPDQQRKDQLDIPSKRICILWDASLSRSKSKENRIKELDALKKIFDVWLTRFMLIEITIIIFRNDMETPKQFLLRSNNWNDFIGIFQDLPYDGATNLSQLASINLMQDMSYYFLFSDCMATMNNDSMIENLYSNFKAPIWIFNGNYLHEPFDIDFIRYLTERNEFGGGYLNRDKLDLSQDDLVKTIETLQIKYVQISSNATIQQIYPSNSISIPLNLDRFLLVGKIPSPLPNEIQCEMQFSMNNQISRVPVSFNLSSIPLDSIGLLRRLWAQQKLNELNAFKDKYKSEILSIGLEYSIVSQFTSLLVLETLEQHLQYRVRPAKSRTLLYNQYMQRETQNNQKKTSNISLLLQQWNQTCQCYDKIITDVDRHRAFLAKFTPSITFGGSGVSNTSSFPTVGNFATAPAFLSVPTAAAQAPTGIFGFGSAAATTTAASATTLPPTGGFSFGSTTATSNSFAQPQTGTFNFGSSPSNNSGNGSTEDTPTIVLNEQNSQASYLTRISSSTNLTSAYSVYLSERSSNHQSPSFYFDVASYFFSLKSFASALDKFNQTEENVPHLVDPKSIEYGLRILTNILELELEAPQLYRTVAYKLMELKQWNIALSIFRKVYSLRSDEPQSLRDLAMVHTELGQWDQAYDYFKKILNEVWDVRFNNIHTTVLLDLNRLLVLTNKPSSDIDGRLIRHLPADIRILIQWDTADTRIKLSVKEPTGQICESAGLLRTDIGGFITTGFDSSQPVEYLLRKAINGTYSISLTYLTNAQHTVTGVTTVLIYVYKYFGSINEERQIHTVRLSDRLQTVDIGQIEFGDPNLEKLKNELEKSKDECNRLQNLLIGAQKKSVSLVEHINVACDGCSMSPIMGDRYKCIFCPNLDFCENCQSSAHLLHDIKHPLLCIRDTNSYRSSIYVQNMSQLIHSNISCVLCHASPIVGIRYQCVTCNVNICERCEFLCLHDTSHQRMKFIVP